MKKFILTFAAVVVAAVAAMAADLTQVWDQIKAIDTFMVVDVPAEQARQADFQTMTVALNTAPTTDQILDTKRILATIDPSRKLAAVSQEGVDVSIYGAPASTDGSLFNLLVFVAQPSGEDKALVVLFGTCTAEQMQRAVANLSIENIIGG